MHTSEFSEISGCSLFTRFFDNYLLSIALFRVATASNYLLACYCCITSARSEPSFRFSFDRELGFHVYKCSERALFASHDSSTQDTNSQSWIFIFRLRRLSLSCIFLLWSLVKFKFLRGLFLHAAIAQVQSKRSLQNCEPYIITLARRLIRQQKFSACRSVLRFQFRLLERIRDARHHHLLFSVCMIRHQLPELN